MGYSLRLEGDVRKLMAKLHNIENLDKKGISATLGEALRSSTMERFKTEKDPDNKKWTRSVRAIQEGGVTLSKSAALKNSIKSRSDASGFAVGTNKVYARTHQFGEKGREITIRARTSRGLVFRFGDRWICKKEVKINYKTPARRYLGISEEDMLEIKATLEDAVIGDD